MIEFILLLVMFQITIEILLIHFLADFGLQTHHQATTKGEGMKVFNWGLFKHVLSYSLVWLVWLYCQFGLEWSVLIGTVFIFITHYITDWITSRLSKPLFAEGNYHDGFVVVGADQLVHYITLFFIYTYIIWQTQN